MTNCFIFVYERLRMEGVKLPDEWEGMTFDKKDLILNHETYLEEKRHFAFFESFCDKVKVPRYGDIVINNNGIGFAVNQFKQISILDKTGKPKIYNIAKRDKIMRVR